LVRQELSPHARGGIRLRNRALPGRTRCVRMRTMAIQAVLREASSGLEGRIAAMRRRARSPAEGGVRWRSGRLAGAHTSQRTSPRRRRGLDARTRPVQLGRVMDGTVTNSDMSPMPGATALRGARVGADSARVWWRRGPTRHGVGCGAGSGTRRVDFLLDTGGLTGLKGRVEQRNRFREPAVRSSDEGGTSLAARVGRGRLRQAKETHPPAVVFVASPTVPRPRPGARLSQPGAGPGRDSRGWGWLQHEFHIAARPPRANAVRTTPNRWARWRGRAPPNRRKIARLEGRAGCARCATASSWSRGGGADATGEKM